MIFAKIGMKYADWILDDETIVAAIYQALGKRHPKEPQSRSARDASRSGPAPADSPSMSVTGATRFSKREVRANLVYATSPAWAAARCWMLRVLRNGVQGRTALSSMVSQIGGASDHERENFDRRR